MGILGGLPARQATPMAVLLEPRTDERKMSLKK